MRPLILVAALALVPALACAESMPAQEQIAAGKALAQLQCSSCHAGTGKGSGTDTAPSFVAVASSRSPDFLDAYLKGFPTKRHSTMPPVDLTNAQVEALVAFIASLKK
jgi:mono/diheme cytochrome c family protein